MRYFNHAKVHLAVPHDGLPQSHNYQIFVNQSHLNLYGQNVDNRVIRGREEEGEEEMGSP